MKLIYAALLVIEINTSAGSLRYDIPMPTMEYCLQAFDRMSGNWQMLRDVDYESSMYCRKKSHPRKDGERR